MKIEGFEAIIKSIKKTSIKEVEVKSKLTQFKIIRKDDEILSQQKAHTLPTSSQVKSPGKEIKVDKDEKLDILSPQIGFFSRYHPKTKKQYVKLRDVVKKGDVVGNVISMHIHHQVISQIDGKISEFLVEEKQPVEYEQPLIRLIHE